MVSKIFNQILKLISSFLIYLLILVFAVVPFVSIVALVGSLKPSISAYVSAYFPPKTGLSPLISFVGGYTITTLLVSIYVFLSFFYGKDRQLGSKIQSTFMSSIFLVSAVRFLQYPAGKEIYSFFETILIQSLVLLPFVGVVGIMRSLFIRKEDPLSIITELGRELKDKGLEETNLSNYTEDIPIIAGIKSAMEQKKSIGSFLIVFPICGFSTYLVEITLLSKTPIYLFNVLAVVTLLVILLASDL